MNMNMNILSKLWKIKIENNVRRGTSFSVANKIYDDGISFFKGYEKLLNENGYTKRETQNYVIFEKAGSEKTKPQCVLYG